MFIDTEGNTWYKGNLHMHTTRSDGGKSYEDAVRLYKESGYDFVAVTDHWLYGEGREEKDFLILSGCEYNMGATVRDKVFHLVGIGMEHPTGLSSEEELTPQKVIDRVAAAGGITELAHPAWSMTLVQDVLPLKGLFATEIYNSVSDRPWNCRAYSGDFIDLCAAYGKILPVIAVDDVHFYEGDETKSFVWVKAEALNRESILSALKKGDFLASQGPFFDVKVENGVFSVKSASPLSEVVFYNDAVYCADRTTRGENITEACCRIRPEMTFMRAEVLDAEGKKAWSSPILVNGNS